MTVDGRWMEELDLTIRSYWVVKKLGVNTVGDLLTTTSAVDVVVLPGSAKRCRYELVHKLARAGVDPATVDAWAEAPARHPVPAYPDDPHPWGLLFTAGEPAGVAEGIRAVHRDGADDVVVYRDGTFSVVLSRRHETVPAAGNALAAGLSAALGRAVYAFRQGGPVGHLVAYENGAAARGFATGGEPLGLPALDLGELPLSRAERASLPGLSRNLPALLRLLDIRSYGYGQHNPEHDEGSPTTVWLSLG